MEKPISNLEREFLKFIEINKPKDNDYGTLVSDLIFSLAIIAFEKATNKGMAYFLMLEYINKAYGHMLNAKPD